MKKHHKYILDLIMTIVMILLMKIAFVGILWHELIGLGIFFLFVIHNILNFKFFKTVFKKFFSSSMKMKIKLGIVLDIILSLVVTGIIITGIMISKEIFPFGYIGFTSSLHHSLSYLSIILISVHIGLHWQEIMGGFRKLFRLKTLSKLRTYSLRVVTIFIVIFGIKGSFNQDLSGKLLEVVKSSDNKIAKENQVEGYSNTGSSIVEESKINQYKNHNGNGNDDGDDKDDKKVISSTDTNTTTTTAPVSLQEYLSKLHCNGCSKHCPLTAPQCGIGEQQAIQATDEYNATKTTTKTTDASSSNTTAPVSLEEYLSKLHCNGCSRHCPLSAPQCGVGERQAVEATSVYYKEESISGEAVQTTNLGEVLTDYLPMMGMFIAGTHYLVMIPKYLKERYL